MTSTVTPTSSATAIAIGLIAGGWEAHARALLDSTSVRLELRAGIQEPVPTSQRVICFVQRPAPAVAQALTAETSADPQALLESWCTAAQRVLRLYQRSPGQFLLLDVDEVLLRPAAAARLCAEHLGMAGTTANPALVMIPAPDPLRQSLATAAVMLNRRARMLAEQLQASCSTVDADGLDDSAEPLPPLKAAAAQLALLEASSQASTARVDALSSVAQDLSQQRDAARERLAVVQRDEAAVIEQLHRTQAELESLGSQYAALASEAERQEQAHAALQSRANESEQHLTQIRAAKEQLARESQTEIESLTKQRAALVAEAMQHAQAYAALQLRAGESERQAKDAQAKLSQVNASLTQCTQALQVSQRDQDLLLVQLHQVQEELERYYLENERLAAMGVAGPSDGVRVDRLQPGLLRDEAPHREANFMLEGVRVGETECSAIQVRLLDHHGRAGLAVFAPAAGQPPLSHWQPAGDEGGRGFMLFIPSDANTHAAFAALSRPDIRLLRGIAERLAASVHERRAAMPPRWPITATRLLHEMDGLPRRFRFDDARVRQAGGAGAVRVDLSNAGLDAGRAIDALALSWTPGAGRDPGTLELSLPDGAVPPLAVWPLDSEGLPAPTWRLPLGRSVAPGVQHRQWRAMSAGDRSWLLALLEALPSALRRADPPPGVEMVRLAVQSEALAPAALRALAGPLWRRVARTLRGRALT